MKHEIVIVGSGHAGGMLAIFLRKYKYRGKITIIGNENFLPYQKPGLSKQFLAGEIEQERLYLRNPDFFKRNNISLILNTGVISVNRVDQTLLLGNKKLIEYKTLVLATGSRVNKINNDNNDTCYLRTINDSIRLRSLLKSSNKISIVGAGFIGLEIAAISIKKGLEVEVIENSNRVLSRVVSQEMSSFFQGKHKSEGVNFTFNTSVSKIIKKNNSYEIVLKNNTTKQSDIVAIGIGVKPNIKIAEEAGLKCNNGIVVDENCITSDKNILAIGDCTYHPNKIFNTHFRLESVQNAVDQALTASKFLLGVPEPYNEVPWFWSDQYNISLQIAGISDHYDDLIIRGSIEQEKFSILFFKEGKLTGIESINSPKDFVSSKKIIKNSIKIDKALLQNDNFNLKKVL
jgi:3-phenylpropionate/trans-cinnamate dioxygenase ferredoxin reductase component